MMHLKSRLLIVSRFAFSFIITLMLIEIGSGILLHQMVSFGNSFIDSKNPLGRRGWYEYTMPKKHDSDYLIIVIANSQGVSPLDATSGLFTDHLELLLNENSEKTYTVLNWAMEGARVAEFMVSLTRLIDYDPDLIIVSSHGESFYINKSQPIQYYGNDIVRLGYQFPYRQYLSNEFISRHSINDPLWFLLHNTNLGRLHQYVQDGLDWSRRVGAPNLDVREVYRKNSWDDDAYWYVQDLFATRKRVIGVETPLLMISMPVNASKRRDVRYRPMAEFGDVLKEYKPENENVFVVDAIDDLDYDNFADGTHYTLEGHQVYASYLFELLSELPILENSKSLD